VSQAILIEQEVDGASGLPEGWAMEKLGALGNWSGGGTPSKQKPEFWEGGTIPWVSPKDMKFASIDDSQDHITEDAVKGSSTKMLPKDSLLIVTRSGILQHSLPVATNSREVALNQDLKALTPSEGLSVKYLYFALKRFEREILHKCCKAGTTVQSIEFPRLKDFEIPIAPLPEQRRIVARIEALFTRLDAGVAALKQAKAQLKRYRQSVLAAAVTGELTQEWREANLDVAPQGKSKDLFGVELPSSWRCIPLSEAVDEGPRNGYSPKCGNSPGGSKVLKLSATSSGQMLLNEKTTKVSLLPVDPSSHAWLKPKDVLIQRANSLELLGSTAIYEGKPDDFVFPDLMMRVRVKENCTRKLLVMFLNSLPARNFFQRNATGVAGNMPKINGATVKALPVPLPPLAEQHEIVAEVEARTTAIDHLEAELDEQITRSNRLRQSTLTSAFIGKLTP